MQAQRQGQAAQVHIARNVAGDGSQRHAVGVVAVGSGEAVIFDDDIEDTLIVLLARHFRCRRLGGNRYYENNV